MNLRFEVPGPPQGKGRPRFSTFGGFARAYTPAKTRSYESEISKAARKAFGGGPLIEAPCSLCIVVRHPIPISWSLKKRARALALEIRPTSKPDLDNVEKAVLDALNGVIYHDDSQVVSRSGTAFYSENPGISVHIASLNAEASTRRKAAKA